MQMSHHNIDLSALSRAQLQELSRDVAEELVTREHDERIALEEKLRSLVEDAGFDPNDLRFGTVRRAKRAKHTKQSKGESE